MPYRTGWNYMFLSDFFISFFLIQWFTFSQMGLPLLPSLSQMLICIKFLPKSSYKLCTDWFICISALLIMYSLTAVNNHDHLFCIINSYRLITALDKRTDTYRYTKWYCHLWSAKIRLEELLISYFKSL